MFSAQYFIAKNPIQKLYYDDDTVVGGTGDDTVVGGTGDDTVVGGTGGDLNNPPGQKRTFTQDEVNAILAKDRKATQAQTQRYVKELENLKKMKGLTDKEKESLQAKIDELNNSMLTKEQLATKEKEKLETTHKKTVQELTTERDTWKNLFTTSTINNAILSEAASAEAFDPENLIALLGPNTRLIEDTGEENQPLGTYVPKVKFKDTDSEGKPITLDMTVPEAVKRMKEMSKFSHLFKSTATSGLGGSPGAGGKKRIDPKNMTVAQYRAQRKELKGG